MKNLFPKFLFVAVAVAIVLRCWLFFERTNAGDDWDKMLTFIVAVFGCAAAIYTIHDTARNVERSTVHARTSAAFQFIHHLDDLGLAKYAEFRIKLSREGLQVKGEDEKIDAEIERKIAKKVEEEHGMRETITNILAGFEDMSMAIKSKFADEDVLYYSLMGVMKWSVDNLKLQIKETRNYRGESYLIELHELVKVWRRNESLLTGRKYKGDSYINWTDGRAG
jgi:hypothetical protein